MTSDELVTINQASTITKVSRRTIYNWLKLGKVRGLRTAGGSVRIYADSLYRNLDEGEPIRETTLRAGRGRLPAAEIPSHAGPLSNPTAR
jgi:excisionase family DNA binding protein